MKLGIIADTHDHLDPRIPTLLRGVDHILHAGDVGDPSLIAELETIAPVTVVAGNNDLYPAWRTTEIRELLGVRILVEHIVHPQAPTHTFEERLRKTQPHVVVFGHTHRPFRQTIDGILFLNPGSATAPRHGLPPSIAFLHLNHHPPRADFISLDGQPLRF